MEYTQHQKSEQIAWLTSQVHDLERQHFEQSQFAAMASAAADLSAPAEDDQSAEANQVRQMRQAYADNATQHRQSALECERRLAVLRIALGSLDDKVTADTEVQQKA